MYCVLNCVYAFTVGELNQLQNIFVFFCRIIFFLFLTRSVCEPCLLFHIIIFGVFFFWALCYWNFFCFTSVEFVWILNLHWRWFIKFQQCFKFYVYVNMWSHCDGIYTYKEMSNNNKSTCYWYRLKFLLTKVFVKPATIENVQTSKKNYQIKT